MHIELCNSLDYSQKLNLPLTDLIVYVVNKCRMVFVGNEGKPILQCKSVPPFWWNRLILCGPTYTPTWYKSPSMAFFGSCQGYSPQNFGGMSPHLLCNQAPP